MYQRLTLSFILIFTYHQGEDSEKITTSPDQDNQDEIMINEPPVLNNLPSNLLKEALCSDVGMYLIYLIIALISILVARRFYSA